MDERSLKRSRMFLSAMFKLRNIGVLIAVMSLSSILSSQRNIPADYNLLMMAGSVVVYFSFVIQTLLNKPFQEEFNRKEKFRKIRTLNYQANRLASEARRNTNNKYMVKLRKVMADKNDIFTSYSSGEPSYLKERIVEQTLNLVTVYLKLLNNFCIRNRELSGLDISTIVSRLNNNSRKLNFVKDVNTSEDLKKIIRMDERLIDRIKEEKQDLERISSKLEYMESTVNMFKHQIISSIENVEMLEQLEIAVNEAEALDAVLEERRKNRFGITPKSGRIEESDKYRSSTAASARADMTGDDISNKDSYSKDRDKNKIRN